MRRPKLSRVEVATLLFSPGVALSPRFHPLSFGAVSRLGAFWGSSWVGAAYLSCGFRRSRPSGASQSPERGVPGAGLVGGGLGGCDRHLRESGAGQAGTVERDVELG